MKLYTDGGCQVRSENKPGAHGVIVVDNNNNEILRWESNLELNTTNNQQEIKAMRRALLLVRQGGWSGCTIYTDSEYVKKGLTDKIILVGPVSEKDKYWLYKNCTAFLFPSLAEGFGLPVIEAMQLGAPVITSDCGSLKEVGGNVASYFTDWNSECMAQVIQEKLDKIEIDPHSFRENSRMHAEQFSWSRSIKGYIDLYERLLSSS